MKKTTLLVLALVLPALASAQVQLMSGYNFGQFLGAGYPSLSGETFDPSPSIGSNFRLTSQPPSNSSGDYVVNNGTPGDYATGFGRIYWDGTNGSTVYNYSNGIAITASDVAINSVNGQTVQGYNMALQGDGLNLALTSNVVGGKIAFIQDTTGFMDFDPTGYADGPGVVSDANLTFAAFSSAPVTIDWFLNGSGSSFASTLISGASMTAYSLDLPEGFFGLSGAQLVAQFSGTATIDNVQFNGVAVSAIPEPSTYAALFGVVTLGVAAFRRRRKLAA